MQPDEVRLQVGEQHREVWSPEGWAELEAATANVTSRITVKFSLRR